MRKNGSESEGWVLTDQSFLFHPSAGILRFVRRLMDRSCGPRLQNLVLSREKRSFCRAGRARTIGCEKSWLNVFERLVTPLRLPGKKLWVDLIKSFGSKLVASHGGESFAFSSRRLWKQGNWPWWKVLIRNIIGLFLLLCVICIEFVRLSESKFACFNPTDVLEI